MTSTALVDSELHLLAEVWDEPTRVRQREALLASALLHVALLVFLVIEGKLFPAPKHIPTKMERHVALLLPPPKELTQKEPNRGPRPKMFVGEHLLPRPPLQIVPKAIPSAPPPPSRPKPEMAFDEKPPQLAPQPDLGVAPMPQIIPPPAAAAPPKLALEDVNKQRAGGQQGASQPGLLAQQRPGSAVEGAVRDLARGAGKGGTAVGDGFGGGVPEGVTAPSPGNAGSSLELLSDPMGVDFRPYLMRILATVRRNWYAVIPESARLGMVRGRVAIQFIIIRQGSVSKLVIADASGHEALDRAAVAGISASNPFPALPTEFRGDQIRLQFTFLYNIPVTGRR